MLCRLCVFANTNAFETASLRRYVLMCLSILLVSPVQREIQKDLARALVSHIMPSLSEAAGSRKVSAGWSLEPRVPSLDCTIHNAQNPGVFAPTTVPLILSTTALFSAATWYDDGSSVPEKIARYGRNLNLRRYGERSRARIMSDQTGVRRNECFLMCEQRAGVSALSIYHLQCEIIYFIVREIFQRDIRRALPAFPH